MVGRCSLGLGCKPFYRNVVIHWLLIQEMPLRFAVWEPTLFKGNLHSSIYEYTCSRRRAEEEDIFFCLPREKWILQIIYRATTILYKIAKNDICIANLQKNAAKTSLPQWQLTECKWKLRHNGVRSNFNFILWVAYGATKATHLLFNYKARAYWTW